MLQNIPSNTKRTRGLEKNAGSNNLNSCNILRAYFIIDIITKRKLNANFLL